MSQPSAPLPDEADQPIVHVEPPRFLARTGRHGNYKLDKDRRWVYAEPADERADDLGYASTPFRALDREPECVGPAILESYAQLNARIYTQRHALEVAEAQERRPELTPQKRLDDVYRRAKDGRYDDLKRPIHVIQKELDKARMKGQAPKSRTLERIEQLEALLDGVSVLRMAA